MTCLVVPYSSVSVKKKENEEGYLGCGFPAFYLTWACFCPLRDST